MKRRQLLIGAAGLFGTGLLMTACGTTEKPAAANKPTTEPKGEITFWSSLAGLDKVTEAFNASQSNIKVTFETIPNGVNGGYAKLAPMSPPSSTRSCPSLSATATCSPSTS